MAIKQNLKPRTLTYYVYGSPRYTTVTDMDRVDATFSRVRPTPLTPTPMTVTRVRYSKKCYPSSSKPYLTGCVPPVQTATDTRLRTSAPTQADSNAAYASARANMTGSLMNLGETLGSAKETMQMVSKRMFQVASLFNSIRKGRFDDAAKILKDEVPSRVKSMPASKRLSEGFLEVQFGWRPLMSDIYSAIDVYRSDIVKGQVVRSGGRSNQPKLDGNFDGEETNFTGGVSSRVMGTVQNANLRTLNALGLANPLLTAWELTPFSFVVDWFMPVSDILAYMSSDLGLRNLMAYQLSVQHKIREYRVDGTWIVWEHEKFIWRTPYDPTMAMPHLYFRSFNTGISRVATAAALIRANLR